MPENHEIEQVLHGYDRGHRLLAASTRISSEDDRAMLTMSDLSGSRVVDGFLEYITGYMLPSREFFALAKTWYAAEMKRPGCVWTHTLLLPRKLLRELRNAESLLSLFVRPQLDQKFRYSEKLIVPLPAWQDDPIGADALSIEQVRAIEELYQYEKGCVGIYAVSGTEYESFLLKVWSQMWPELRETVGFCSGSLSLRVLNGRPLDLQCGPDRIVRELKTERAGFIEEAPGIRKLLDDLQRPGPFREFVRENAAGLGSRSSMSFLAELFELIAMRNFVPALRKAGSGKYVGESSALKRTVLRETIGFSGHLDIQLTLAAVSAGAFEGAMSEVKGLFAKFLHDDVKVFLLACDSLKLIGNPRYSSVLADTIASELTQADFEWMSEGAPELFSKMLIERPVIAYQRSFWNWNLSLFEKVDLFRSLIRCSNLEKGLLFEGVFASGDSELLSRLVGELSGDELPLVLEWIQSNEQAATSLEWTAFLRMHQPEFISWLNQKKQPTLQTLVLAANVLDEPPPLHKSLSADTILGLATAARTLPRNRHEVAAFLFATTAWVHQEQVAPIFIDSFAVLHKAIAESRLSNRAWQIVSSNLMPLPNEQWDSCEKLRRATLHFIWVNGWNFRLLWRVVERDLDLFYDFIRTARSYDEGRQFLRSIYESSERGEVTIEKKQSKELRKLLGQNRW